MSGIDTTIAGIETKVQQLVDENLSLRIKVQKQEVAIAGMQEDINNNNQTIKNLKEEHNKLTTRNAPTSECNPAEIEHRIDQLIQTIDETLQSIE